MPTMYYKKNKLTGGNTGGGGSEQITVDSSILEDSINPVQNRVIAIELNKKANAEDIPTKLSDLTNDAGFITEDTNTTYTFEKTSTGFKVTPSNGQPQNIDVGSNITVDSTLSSTSTNPVQNKIIKGELDKKLESSALTGYTKDADLASVAKSGSYNDLDNKPTIPTVPTNVSAFTNDSGYITEHQSLSEYRKSSDQDIIDNNKVDKVEGKGLSTYDYNLAAKNKVDAIPLNPKYTDTVYDDTALAGRVSAIEGKESTWNNKLDSISDLATIRDGAALGATALQSFTETDPTVPAWAKAPTKPSYTAAEVGALPSDTALFSGSYVDLTGKPTKLSDFTNDGVFITKTVNDLTNYYLKTETYTQAEVNGLISSIPKFAITVVSTLPTSNISTTTVYLLKTSDETQNLYTEYIYVNSKWEKLGELKVDLTGYATESWVEGKNYLTQHQSLSEYRKASDLDVIDNSKVDKIEGKGLSTYDYNLTAKNKVDAIPSNPKYTDTVYDDTALANRVSAIETKETTWDGKLDAISDLATIRSGAALGATALQSESDPTVPNWAKQPKKPTYTASEVGALPSTTVIPTVPTNVSAFTNDAGYITDISGKVDKVDGKQLSTEDFTTELKTKLESLTPTGGGTLVKIIKWED